MTAQQEMFQAVCDLFAYDPARLTATERTKVGKAAKELLAARARPAEVACARRAWERLFHPDPPLFSEMGLIAHWSKLRPLIERSQQAAAKRQKQSIGEEPVRPLPREETVRRARALRDRLVENFTE